MILFKDIYIKRSNKTPSCLIQIVMLLISILFQLFDDKMFLLKRLQFLQGLILVQVTYYQNIP